MFADSLAIITIRLDLSGFCVGLIQRKAVPGVSRPYLTCKGEEVVLDTYPRFETGYFHLTGTGWIRKDYLPYPPDRVETWKYEMEREANDAKEQVCLTRVWSDPHATASDVAYLHRQYDHPLAPERGRNVKLECEV